METVNLTRTQAQEMYRVIIRKYQATRWSYSVHNPQGGSFSMTGYKSQKHALHAALRGLPTAQDVLVVCMNWDPETGEYKTARQFVTSHNRETL